MARSDPAQGGARLGPLDGVVAEVRVHLDVVDALEHRPAVDQRRPEGAGAPHPGVDERPGGGGGLVVDLGAAVGVEGDALAHAVVAVDHAVADEDAVGAEAVVVAVDGQDGVVLGGDLAGPGGDVGAVLVVGEGAAHDRGVGCDDVGRVVGERVRAGAGGGPRDGDGGVGGGVGGVGHRHVGGRGGLGGSDGGVGGLVGGDVGDLGVVDDEAVQRPGARAGGGQSQDGGATHEEASAGVLLAGRRLAASGARRLRGLRAAHGAPPSTAAVWRL